MHRYGIRGIVLNCVSSYLSNRQQFLQVDEVIEDLKNIVCDIPQGSTLGRNLLLTLMIYVMSLTSHSLLYLHMTSNTFYSDCNINTLFCLLNFELNKRHSWLNINKLPLNVSTTNYMLFTNRELDSEMPIVINGARGSMSQIF